MKYMTANVQGAGPVVIRTKDDYGYIVWPDGIIDPCRIRQGLVKFGPRQKPVRHTAIKRIRDWARRALEYQIATQKPVDTWFEFPV